MHSSKRTATAVLLTALTACSAVTAAVLPAAAAATTTVTSTAMTTERVYTGTSTFPVSGTNTSRESDQLVVYTRTATQTATPTNRWGVEVAVVGGVVTAVSDRQRTGAGPLQIPAGGIVLSGHGTARTWLLTHARLGTSGISAPGMVTRASTGTASYLVAGTNISRAAHALVVYTRTATQAVTPTNQWGAEAVVQDGRVTAIVDRQHTGGPAVGIPTGGAVLSGHGAARTWLLANAKVGASVQHPGVVPVASAPVPVSAPEPAEPVVAPEPVAVEPVAVQPVAPTTVPYFKDDFEGSPLSPYISSSLNASHAKWFGESGSDPVQRTGGLGVKSGSTRFFRMWTKDSVGGPNQGVRIKAKVRTTSIYVRDTGGIVEGTKMWLKWPHQADEAYPGPASVRGIVDGTSPGSYIYSFHTHNGYSEVMKRAPGQETSTAYTFFKNIRAPYALGTWEDVEMTFEWLPDRLRIRSFRNGVLQMEANDTSSDRMMIPGYAGIRSDDSKFEIADFTVEPFSAS